MLPLGGWFMHKKIVAQELDTEGHAFFAAWRFVVRFVSSTLVAMVMMFTLIDSF